MPGCNADHKTTEEKKHDMVLPGNIIDSDTEGRWDLPQVSGCQTLLQYNCYIMARTAAPFNVPQSCQRVHMILDMRGTSIKIVRHIIKEYAESVEGAWNLEYEGMGRSTFWGCWRTSRVPMPWAAQTLLYNSHSGSLAPRGLTFGFIKASFGKNENKTNMI